MTEYNNEFADAFASLVASRRSIRAFKPDRVPTDVLEQIFSDAAAAPSNCNSQPWKIAVVSGEARDRMAEGLKETIGKGDYVLDFPYDTKQYEGVYRERQVDVGKLLYVSMGIGRGDKEGRINAFMRNLDFFDAPHAAFLFMPDWCGIREASDIGMYAQTLLLSMQAHGIASCPQTILGYNADVVREQLNIDSSFKLLFGISFGYADMDKPENLIVPDRAALNETTTFFE